MKTVVLAAAVVVGGFVVYQWGLLLNTLAGHLKNGSEKYTTTKRKKHDSHLL